MNECEVNEVREEREIEATQIGIIFVTYLAQ